jgi:preprotein translocase subunit YajC
MKNLWILAQEEANQAPSKINATPVNEREETKITVPSDSNNLTKTKQAPKSIFGDYTQLIFIVLIFVVMYFVLLRGPKKRQQEHKQMVQTLKKNDKVRTVGGIIGTVVDIKEDEIILKVDESNNTKIRVVPSAIATNLSTEKKQ